MMRGSDSTPHSKASPLFDALSRRWWVVAVCVFLGTGLTLLSALQETPVYRSTAKVLISDRDLAGAVSGVPEGALDRTSNVSTEAQIAGLPTVLARAKSQLGGAATEPALSATVSLAVATTPTAAGGSNILNVYAESTDRNYSTRLAGATADQYVAFRGELSTKEIRAARDELAQSVGRLEAAGRDSGTLYTELVGRLQQLDTLLILGSSRASVLEAGNAAVQVAPSPTRSGVLAFLLSLAVGCVGALLVDRLDRRIRSHSDVADLLGSSILGTLPDPRRKDGAPSVVARTDLVSPAAEAFRTLRAHIRLALAARGGKSLLLTSALQSEGKTYVAVNYALSAASAGEDVILVDLDLRRPMAHRYLSLPISPGLSDVILGERSLEHALIDVPLPPGSASQGRLRFLPAGRRVPNPGEFVASAAVADQIQRLTASAADLILLDTPPLLPVSDATALAALVDATLVVVRVDSASRTSLERLRAMLTSGSHDAIGVVLTAAWKKRIDYAEGYVSDPSESHFDAKPATDGDGTRALEASLREAKASRYSR